MWLTSPDISEEREPQRVQGPDEVADFRMQQASAHRALQEVVAEVTGAPELEPRGACSSGSNSAGVSSPG